jgi:hypothetical protein
MKGIGEGDERVDWESEACERIGQRNYRVSTYIPHGVKSNGRDLFQGEIRRAVTQISAEYRGSNFMIVAIGIAIPAHG